MSLEDIIRRFRKPGRRDPREFVTTWTEEEILDSKVVDCYVIVLRTRGCYWSRTSGCSMCGYIFDCAEEASPDEIASQFEMAMESYKGQPFIKIYTSGSFLDTDEIEFEAAIEILGHALDEADRVLIESRPEFVSPGRLECLPSPRRVEIAFGLESANDVVLQRSINKRMTFEDFRSACKICREMEIRTRAYLLIKPPFLTEKEALRDAISTARASSELVDTISFNPVNVQRNTLVEYLWRRGEYRPPWLWTVIDALMSIGGLGPRILVSSVGAGSRRGAHNCGKCDPGIVDFLEDFSLGRQSTPPEIECTCKEEWLTLLDVQGPMQASADPAFFFDR
ncbi:MAG: archaeosine biosynthesis radical SAM protein RaSEA [Thermoplasmata archaeon]